MEIDGLCRTCGHRFCAHWHKWKRSDGCPRCGSKDIRIETDETDGGKGETTEAPDETNKEE